MNFYTLNKDQNAWETANQMCASKGLCLNFTKTYMDNMIQNMTCNPFLFVCLLDVHVNL